MQREAKAGWLLHETVPSCRRIRRGRNTSLKPPHDEVTLPCGVCRSSFWCCEWIEHKITASTSSSSSPSSVWRSANLLSSADLCAGVSSWLWSQRELLGFGWLADSHRSLSGSIRGRFTRAREKNSEGGNGKWWNEFWTDAAGRYDLFTKWEHGIMGNKTITHTFGVLVRGGNVVPVLEVRLFRFGANVWMCVWLL